MSEEMIKELLEKLKQCDDFHNRCDFLMEHSEITYMLDYINHLQQENQELKKQVEEYKHKGLYNTCLPYSTGYKKAIKEKENQQKEFIKFLENEKDRLASECSQIYEDSLGKTRFVNEDIFNEVDKILSKYYEIIEK